MFYALALNIRLTNQNSGYIEIKDGSTWKKVDEENWKREHQKLMCEHLRFEVTEGKIEIRQLRSEQQDESGVLIYNTQPTGKYPGVSILNLLNPLQILRFRM